MYCVIQEIELKRENKYGEYKELEAYYSQFSINGVEKGYWCYRYTGGRFERPIRKAYKISVHESYRENGKVKKKQVPICTLNYYDLVNFWGLCSESHMEMAADTFQSSYDDIYDLIIEKLTPIMERAQEEFRQTEEYRVHQEHEKITTIYAANKVEFNRKYELDPTGHDYDRCYDVFGNLKNKEYLKKIKADYKYRKEYERKSKSYQKQAYEDFFKNFHSSGRGSGSSSFSVPSSHSEEEKTVLKSFYRELSKKYHPDANPDKDTSKEMQLLNQLKQDWGL